MTLHPGDKLDNYEIERLVARSGMASIYRAKDTRSGIPVALKIPHPEAEADPLLFDRFRREEEIGKKLDHPSVMKVYENDEKRRIYMVLEWVDGRLLRQILIEQKKLPVERAVRLTLNTLDALEYIHSHGVVHRDLKPENIMVVDPEDHIKLIDFGIAGAAGLRRLTFAKLTQAMGTPDYISPEQVKSKRGDARSDIYAMGVMLYEMLTGDVPFHGPNPFAIMNDRLLNNPVPPRELNPEISPQLQEIIYRALERNPANRYSSAKEFANDLQHQDQVGVAERPELRDWKQRRSPWVRQALFYAAMAMIPVLIFGLLFYFAKHNR
jgi:eukaryotic-like serine/threonine-protein kinase